MKAERSDDGGMREVRLEGLGLVLVGGVLLAAICGAYYVGKWVERKNHPVQALGAPGEGPLSRVVQSDGFDDAAEGANFFDESEGENVQREPEREARTDSPPQPAAPATNQDPQTPETRSRVSDPGGEGDYYVQVFAGRDRSSAESLVRKLKTEGYVVKVFSEREGEGTTLFKVRVGGYPTRDRAQSTAALLKDSGYTAWVPPPE